MRKAAPLIISILEEEPVAVDNTKQNKTAKSWQNKSA